MPPTQSKLKGKVLHSQSREIVSNVYRYFKSKGDSPIVIKNITKSIAEATGVSQRSVTRIISESKNIDSGASASFSTPHKQRPRKSPKSALDSFNEAVVRRTVNDYYIVEKERPTLKKIHEKLKQSIEFKGSQSTLRTILKRMGFRWKKTKNNRQILMENHDIRAKRLQYLREIKKYRNEGRSIIYMDETYIHSSHTSSYGWSDDTIQGLLSPISKGKRLIIVHAGGEQGFVPNAYIRFKSHQTTGDYHSDMNYANYEKWLKERLIPNLPQNSVIVIDNAPYHNTQVNRPPNSNSRRADMISWLQNHLPAETFENTDFSSMRNPDIYGMIVPLKPNHLSYKIDGIVQEHHHTILRLPPYHPELNPIELIWATVKNWVAEKNVTFKMDDVIKLTDDKFASISKEDWQLRCRHVIEIENQFMEREGLLDIGHEVVIHLGNWWC